MACTTRRIDAQLEAVTAKWGKQHCRTFTAVANTANVLAGKYLPVNYMTPDLVEVLGYIWFDDGVASDPAPSGKTLIGAVGVTSGDTAAVVAAAMKTTLDAAVVSGTIKAFMPATVTGSTVELQNRFIGAITEETDPDSSGITDTVDTIGVGLELGATSEAVELAFETQVVDITSNQTGGIVGSQIYIGSSANISLSLMELTKERFDLLVGEVTGDSVTPGSGTKVSGYGESRLFQSLDELGGMLILHPIRLAATDRSADVVFWKCAPKPSSLNFDGQAPQVMAVEFTAYLDQNRNTAVNLFAKGDWAQSGLDA